MNDIKKAVELADGWRFNEFDDNLFHFPGMTFGGVYKIDDMQQFVLDALAAQLVRQVDALDDAFFESGPDAGAECSTFDLKKWGGSLNDDRTLNTIRAIVDSGVLE